MTQTTPKQSLAVAKGDVAGPESVCHLAAFPQLGDLGEGEPPRWGDDRGGHVRWLAQLWWYSNCGKTTP